MANTKEISTEEKWMMNYFQELQDEGFIKSIEYQPEPIILSNKVEVPVHKQLKTKTKVVKKTILKERIYTMDFLITWNGDNPFHKSISDDYFENDLPLFFSDMNRSYIEVKANRDLQNTTRFFNSRTQPWIWEKYNIFINLVKVPDIFKNSFIPKMIIDNFYYKRDVTKGKGKERTLKAKKGDKKYIWEYKTLEEFIDENIK